MCTATYLPLSSNSFVLTHSRDEKAIRPAAHPPKAVSIGGQTVTYPQDPQGLGTWFAVSAGLTACLLNGAFMAHKPTPPYKHSRGLVVLDAFDYVSVDAFIRHHSFAGIEPFTLILAETGRLTELRWDAKRLFISDKDPKQPHIWSSVTLYGADVVEQRERWFTQWCAQQPWSAKGIRNFHLAAGAGDPHNALRMNRPQYLTVSLTSVVHDGHHSDMYYQDLTQPTLTSPTPTYLPLTHQPTFLRHAIA